MTQPNIKKTEELERDTKDINNDTLLTVCKVEPVENASGTSKEEKSSFMKLHRTTPRSRLRTGDSAFIFEAPFFQMSTPPDNDKPRGYLISARCLTCNDDIRGVKNVNSNFIRHLRRVHPSVFMEYETTKFNRLKARKMKQQEQKSATSFAQGVYSPTDDATPITTKEILTFATTKLENTLFRRHSMSMGDNEQEQEMQKENEDLEMNLELHQTTDNQHIKILQMEKDLKIMEKRWNEMQMTVEKWRLNQRQMQREIEEIDQKQRKNNIIISNFKLNDDRINLKQSIKKYLNEELSLSDIKIKDVIISNPNAIENKKTLKVELKNADANSVLMAANKLKNTETFVEPDLSTFASKRRNKLLILSKEMLRRNQRLNVIVCGTKMIINGVHYFYWDDVDGLCDEENSADPIGKLNGIAGDTEYNEFIGFLKHFDVQIL